MLLRHELLSRVNDGTKYRTHLVIENKLRGAYRIGRGDGMGETLLPKVNADLVSTVEWTGERRAKAIDGMETKTTNVTYGLRAHNFSVVRCCTTPMPP